MSLHLGTETRDPLPDDIIVFEPEPGLSRETVTALTSGTVRRIKVGTVLGKITASGKYIEHDAAAVDGSQAAWAVAVDNVTVPAAADAEISVIRYHATLRDEGLIFKAGISAPNRAAGIASLLGRYIFTA